MESNLGYLLKSFLLYNSDTNGGSGNAVKMSNGYPDGLANNSPNSSQISADGSAGHHSNDGGPTLISRTQKQHTTQQVIKTQNIYLFSCVFYYFLRRGTPAHIFQVIFNEIILTLWCQVIFEIRSKVFQLNQNV